MLNFVVIHQNPTPFYMNAKLYTWILLVWLTAHVSTFAGNDDWLIGTWRLHYDPDGGTTDYIIFKANGDAISSGPLGEVEGFYTINPASVKAVFSYKEKDFIMTFYFNAQHDELRIVTSDTGRDSIYTKIK